MFRRNYSRRLKFQISGRQPAQRALGKGRTAARRLLPRLASLVAPAPPYSRMAPSVAVPRCCRSHRSCRAVRGWSASGPPRDLPPLKWCSLKYGFDHGGAAPFCGPGSRQFLELFEFGVRTRSASSYRARYVVFRCCRDARKLPARTQRHPLGFAFGCAVARSAGELRASDHLLQPLRSLAAGRRSVAENKFVDLFYAWPPSGLRLTFESWRGFPADWMHASLAYEPEFPSLSSLPIAAV